MDIEGLATFVAIHEAGGFSAAADRLGRSQPAISRRIALLEQELGGRLLERASGGVVLSQLGQVLLPHAQWVLAAANDAREAVAEMAGSGAGPIALAVVRSSRALLHGLCGPTLQPSPRWL